MKLWRSELDVDQWHYWAAVSRNVHKNDWERITEGQKAEQRPETSTDEMTCAVTSTATWKPTCTRLCTSQFVGQRFLSELSPGCGHRAVMVHQLEVSTPPSQSSPVQVVKGKAGMDREPREVLWSLCLPRRADSFLTHHFFPEKAPFPGSQL